MKITAKDVRVALEAIEIESGIPAPARSCISQAINSIYQGHLRSADDALDLAMSRLQDRGVLQRVRRARARLSKVIASQM